MKKFRALLLSMVMLTSVCPLYGFTSVKEEMPADPTETITPEEVGQEVEKAINSVDVALDEITNEDVTVVEEIARDELENGEDGVNDLLHEIDELKDAAESGLKTVKGIVEAQGETVAEAASKALEARDSAREYNEGTKRLYDRAVKDNTKEEAQKHADRAAANTKLVEEFAGEANDAAEDAVDAAGFADSVVEASGEAVERINERIAEKLGQAVDQAEAAAADTLDAFNIARKAFKNAKEELAAAEGELADAEATAFEAGEALLAAEMAAEEALETKEAYDSAAEVTNRLKAAADKNLDDAKGAYKGAFGRLLGSIAAVRESLQWVAATGVTADMVQGVDNRVNNIVQTSPNYDVADTRINKRVNSKLVQAQAAIEELLGKVEEKDQNTLGFKVLTMMNFALKDQTHEIAEHEVKSESLEDANTIHDASKALLDFSVGNVSRSATELREAGATVARNYVVKEVVTAVNDLINTAAQQAGEEYDAAVEAEGEAARVKEVADEGVVMAEEAVADAQEAYDDAKYEKNIAKDAANDAAAAYDAVSALAEQGVTVDETYLDEAKAMAEEIDGLAERATKYAAQSDTAARKSGQWAEAAQEEADSKEPNE